ncbi:MULTISPECIES: LPS export ABC transporter ATP-binding protein [Mesotoga]|uniref:ABC-type (Unclassified) transport system, ATPase component n=1 Tax=Mesotoga prima MesG1.Ag.4.2 TaxID=660470 RepID=I2F6G4_9BACT|nr:MULTISPECIES: LPS export ABC transporter ATP-binding protein [Mesotoga]MCP5457809.1 LPS export ABC transporter ATP-binding protein [Thermotogota bacterium]CCU84613.1 Lipopolysaccharide export system ATP-binding protein LptB [Mesotoga infera]AFK07517.1 ABC-type (unclassified) transport system, ATPase component [Mesotoga prima MesG1.Ag.4.2]MCP5461302.1 LPS export ABC transporter ATP-binding protein [Thermotogota bacterium]MDK2944323.1 lipopolysaccharide export system ATP-binding protein [Meso
MSDPSYLKCEHLDKRYGKRRVLKDVSLEASSLEVVGLLGPNGAGKTTAFKSILGIVIPNSGSIFLDGENITHLPIHERAKRGIAYLPQETSIFRGLKVIENLTMVMKLTGQEDKCLEKASEILDEFGILSLKDQTASLISGGEKRRLEFARTMTLSPSFILLDEPFVGIDPMTVKDIQKMIRKLKSRGIGVIVTDHDVSSIAKVVDRLYVLYKGEVISSGDPAAVLGDSLVVEKYLGSDE